jgi:ATP-dependent exoDNAse (exonuclease V) beta subunit
MYGRWWHDFIQRIRWRDESLWNRVFEEQQAKSPAATRSAGEWQLFLQCLQSNRDFSKRLTGAGSLAHSEMPFFCRIDRSACLEGLVDLAIFDSSSANGFILDWKTNRIARDQIDALQTRYRPQMAAYWHAIRQLTNASIHAAIYSTATGQLAVYTAEELGDEWERLKSLPPDNLGALIARD